MIYPQAPQWAVFNTPIIMLDPTGVRLWHSNREFQHVTLCDAARKAVEYKDKIEILSHTEELLATVFPGKGNDGCGTFGYSIRTNGES